MSFSRTWKLCLWNITIKEENAPARPLTPEVLPVMKMRSLFFLWIKSVNLTQLVSQLPGKSKVTVWHMVLSSPLTWGTSYYLSWEHVQDKYMGCGLWVVPAWLIKGLDFYVSLHSLSESLWCTSRFLCIQ